MLTFEDDFAPPSPLPGLPSFEPPRTVVGRGILSGRAVDILRNLEELLERLRFTTRRSAHNTRVIKSASLRNFIDLRQTF